MPAADQPTAVELRDRPRIDKWVAWMQHNPNASQSDPGSIWSQIAEMSLHRQYYRRVIGMVEDAELPPSSFWQYLHSTYLRSQAAGIRRQADRHRDAVSLRRVLDELHADLSRLGRPAWVANTDDALTAESVAADISRLEESVAPVTEVVDTRVAHVDQRSVESPLNVRNVDAALDTVIAVFQRYAKFLMWSTVYFDVTIIDDWTAIFRRAWLADSP